MSNPNWPKPGETWKNRKGETILVERKPNGMLFFRLSEDEWPVHLTPKGTYLYDRDDDEHEWDLIEKVKPLPEPVTQLLFYNPTTKTFGTHTYYIPSECQQMKVLITPLNYE